MVDALTAAVPQAPDAPKPKNAHEAASQFEALLLAQMLRTAHASADQSDDQADQTGDTMWDMAAQQFAQVMADNGGLGLAKLITKGLEQSPGRTPDQTQEQAVPAGSGHP